MPTTLAAKSARSRDGRRPASRSPAVSATDSATAAVMPSPRLLLDRAARLADGLLRLALRRLPDALGLGLASAGLVADCGLRLAGRLVRLALHPLCPVAHGVTSFLIQRTTQACSCGNDVSA